MGRLASQNVEGAPRHTKQGLVSIPKCRGYSLSQNAEDYPHPTEEGHAPHPKVQGILPTPQSKGCSASQKVEVIPIPQSRAWSPSHKWGMLPIPKHKGCSPSHKAGHAPRHTEHRRGGNQNSITNSMYKNRIFLKIFFLFNINKP